MMFCYFFIFYVKASGILSFAFDVHVDIGRQEELSEEDDFQWFRAKNVGPAAQQRGWNHGHDPDQTVNLLADTVSPPCQPKKQKQWKWWYLYSCFFDKFFNFLVFLNNNYDNDAPFMDVKATINSSLDMVP